jgi:hypothetical protein
MGLRSKRYGTTQHRFSWTSVVDPDPHHFGNLDPAPHQENNPDPDPHQIKIRIRIRIKGKCGSASGPRLIKIRIRIRNRICIKVTSRIRIRDTGLSAACDKNMRVSRTEPFGNSSDNFTFISFALF